MENNKPEQETYKGLTLNSSITKDEKGNININVTCDEKEMFHHVAVSPKTINKNVSIDHLINIIHKGLIEYAKEVIDKNP